MLSKVFMFLLVTMLWAAVHAKDVTELKSIKTYVAESDKGVPYQYTSKFHQEAFTPNQDPAEYTRPIIKQDAKSRQEALNQALIQLREACPKGALDVVQVEDSRIEGFMLGTVNEEGEILTAITIQALCY